MLLIFIWLVTGIVFSAIVYRYDYWVLKLYPKEYLRRIKLVHILMALFGLLTMLLVIIHIYNKGNYVINIREWM